MAAESAEAAAFDAALAGGYAGAGGDASRLKSMKHKVEAALTTNWLPPIGSTGACVEGLGVGGR